MLKQFYLFLIFISVMGSGFSQTYTYVTSVEYDSLKQNGLLIGNEVIFGNGMANVKPQDIYQEFIVTPKAQGCGGYFDSQGPPLNFTSDDDGAFDANGDGFPDAIPLPFDFCFFGTTYNEVYFNGNGNISFNGSIGTFSPSAFPSAGNEMIAAFWADFDKGGTGTFHGTVTATAAIFNWVEVGYYNDHTDKVNTCQIIITDGADPLVQNGNVAIFYQDMQWTSGDFDGGVNGFGGTAQATAGANKGDGINYFQIGRFDHAGTDYDGPTGAIDGVDWLDNKSFYFDFCTPVGSSNIEPIPVESQYCDTIRICEVGDTLDITFSFLSPENNQNTTITYSAPTLSNEIVLSNTVGPNGELVLRIIGQLETPGVHVIDITATDDGVPAGVTTISYVFEILDASSAFPVDPVLDYIPDCEPISFYVANGPFDEYWWETGSTDSTIALNGNYYDTLTVIVKNGCEFRIDSLVYVPETPVFNMQGDFTYCEGTGGVFLQIPDSLNYGAASWGLPDPLQDSLFSNTLMAGSYTVLLWDSLRYCEVDTSFTVIEYPQPTLTVLDDTVACNLTLIISGTTSYNGGVWSVYDNPSTSVPEDTMLIFNPSELVDNPVVIALTSGTYTLQYTDNTCQTMLDFDVLYPVDPQLTASDTTVCSGDNALLYASVNSSVNSIVWSTGETDPNIIVSTPGDYIVTADNGCQFVIDTATVVWQVCEINAPNIISLSSEDGNNAFFVDQSGIESFHCVITNRWGNFIYEYNDPAGFWDGKNKNGEVVQEGVYFYMIDATLVNGDVIQKQGTINVFH